MTFEEYQKLDAGEKWLARVESMRAIAAVPGVEVVAGDEERPEVVTRHSNKMARPAMNIVTKLSDDFGYRVERIPTAPGSPWLGEFYPGSTRNLFQCVLLNDVFPGAPSDEPRPGVFYSMTLSGNPFARKVTAVQTGDSVRLFFEEVGLDENDSPEDLTAEVRVALQQILAGLHSSQFR